MENIELPKLSNQEQACLLRFFSNGKNKTEAYRFAYNWQNSTNKTVWENASKFFKRTKVIPWIQYYEANQQKVLDEEIRYSIKDAFDELNDLQKKSISSSKTYNIAMKAIENKCRLKGLFLDKVQVSGGNLADVIDQIQ